MFIPIFLPTSEPTLLEWDSQFFERKVGRINISNTSTYTLRLILEAARQQGYELLYAFADEGILVSDDALIATKGMFVDRKMVFEYRLLRSSFPPSPFVRPFILEDNLDEIYSLAYQSGEFSRFRVDPAIGRENFQRLYRQWVDNSIEGVVADAVVVYQLNGLLTGFATVKRNEDTGVIGLIATDTHHRGQGVGTALMNYVKTYAAEAGLSRLEVTTQGLNNLACRFYKNNHFSVKTEICVYHFWL